MEKFSKFFDSIVSGNTGLKKEAGDLRQHESNNNDNIYINNNININNSPFPIEDYYLLSNEIILGAIKLYHKLYNSLDVPFPFIGYYYTEFASDNSNHTNYLQRFLVLFHNKKNNLANAIAIFEKSNHSQTEIKHIKKSSIFNSLKQGFYLVASKELLSKEIVYSDKIDTNLKTAIDETRKTLEYIELSVVARSFKARYLNYLSNIQADTLSSKVEINKKSADTSDERARKIIAPPKQEKPQTVSAIMLPKLSTGKIFPTSFTHSRIDSAHFARKFLEADRIYNLVKKYKFSKARYTEGFETKRKELFKPKKSSFDLF